MSTAPDVAAHANSGAPMRRRAPRDPAPHRAVCILLTLCGGAACGDDAFDPAGAHIRMDFRDEAQGFYAAPFPGAHRVSREGVDLTGFPNPGGRSFVGAMLTLLERDARGAGLSSGIYFETTRAVDPSSLPNVDESTQQTATAQPSVFVAPVMSGDPDTIPWLGALHPVTVMATNAEQDSGRFAGAFGISIVPYQGVPLLPETTYVAVVTSRVRSVGGERWQRPPALTALLAQEQPDGLELASALPYFRASEALRAADLGDTEIVAMTAFVTGDPTSRLRGAHAQLRAGAPPVISSFVAREVFDEFCVFEGSVDMPVFQRGVPPFTTEGGEWARGRNRSGPTKS